VADHGRRPAAPGQASGYITGMADLARFADEHVAAFNAAVASADFGGFLARLTDDAVVRFENVPGAGTLEFTGRAAYTAAYEQQPPDDQIDITAPPRADEGAIVIPFAWRRDGAQGTMRLSLRGGQVAGLIVTFA
jgi:hypothetical protein